MASKNNIDLSNFDFGFSVVDEDELAVVQSVKSEVSDATSTAALWQAQAEEWKAKTNAIKLNKKKISNKETLSPIVSVASQ